MLPARTISLVVLFLLALIAVPTCLYAQQAPPANGDEAKLIAVLKSDAPLFDKGKACQRLAVIGTKESVPALAGLLADEKLSHYARIGLEPIPDPSVDDALREALDKVKGGLLVGVINSINMRRDAKAIDKLIGLLENSDIQVAAAAAAALGRLHTPEAVEALVSAYSNSEVLRPAVSAAALTAAEMLLIEGNQDEAVQVYDAVRDAEVPKFVMLAALQGGILARKAEGVPMMVECLQSKDAGTFAVGLATAQKLPGSEVTKALIEALQRPNQEAASTQGALVIHVLGARGDKAALPVVIEAAKSGPETQRLAAIRVLASLGDASAVPVLLQTAVTSQGELAQAARDSLAELPGKEVDAALTSALGQVKGHQLSVVIELIGLRGITSAEPDLRKLANSDDAQVRTAAVGALGLTVGLDELPALIDRLVKAETPEAAATSKEAMRKACLRMPDREVCAAKLIAPMAKASVAAQRSLLELLGVVGGQKALAAVSEAATSGSGEVQDTATRVLGEWMSPDAAPVLLEMARSNNDKYKIRALRGYIRIIRQLNLPAEEKLSMCRKAMEASGRIEEKKLVLEVLTRLPSAEALAQVIAHLANPELKEAAAAAAVKIGQKIVADQPAAVAEAMPKVIEAGGSSDLAAAANALLDQAKK